MKYRRWLYFKLLKDIRDLKSNLVELCVELSEGDTWRAPNTRAVRMPDAHNHLNQVEHELTEVWSLNVETEPK